MQLSARPRLRRLTALCLAFGMVAAMSSPAAASYCVTKGNKTVVCV